MRLVFFAQEFVLFLKAGTFLLIYTVRSLKLATLSIGGSRIMLSVSFFSFFFHIIWHIAISLFCWRLNEEVWRYNNTTLAGSLLDSWGNKTDVVMTVGLQDLKQREFIHLTVCASCEWNQLYINPVRNIWGTLLVAQLVEALRYKPESRGFDSPWCQWIFHWHNPSGRTMAWGRLSLWVPGMFPGGKGDRFVRLTT
jgi:hypothetical protein